VTQATLTAVRSALATQLAANITGLRAVANRTAQVVPPMAVIVPGGGTFMRYKTTLSGSADLTLRVVLLVAAADSSLGQDVMDPYVATTGTQSVLAAVQADDTLGGVVEYAEVMDATGYGLVNWAGVDYLGCSFTVVAGI
jgi:hypothetical protein